ncbi:glycosyltransferase family 87 protein [Pedobacter sp. UC225_65]|uniref:glycosyltransferase family 87 protein n=1 Tax=Pedobacter sp. UC225_65 TaxID=3350173 RepID=UPI0036724F4C
MSSLNKKEPNLSFWQKIVRLLNNDRFILAVWILLVVAVAVKQLFKPSINNNYLIFKYAYFHAVDHLNLYIVHPEHLDTNHYGPFFSLLIAPFAILPNYLGMFFWQLANVMFLYFAIKQLPITTTKVNAVYWIVAHEMLTSMFSFQFNISIAAIIILAYVFIERKQNFWAAFVIMLGTFVKLYGIVGLAFFFFAKEKPKFIAYCFFWAIVFLVAPMIFFTPSYILQSYHDWYISLSEKQMLNASLTSMQDISVMGMVRRIAQDASIPNLPFLLGGLILFALPYLRIKQYKEPIFRLLFLASTLIFTVIFSNSSESPTYVIAFAGVAIWFVVQERPIDKGTIALFVLALLLTTLSASDLFPRIHKRKLYQTLFFKSITLHFNMARSNL